MIDDRPEFVAFCLIVLVMAAFVGYVVGQLV